MAMLSRRRCIRRAHPFTRTRSNLRPDGALSNMEDMGERRMKLAGLAMVVLATAGCAIQGGLLPGAQSGSLSSSMSSPLPAAPPPQQDDFMPRLVEPATGGIPVTAIPLGGNLYQPVTGGLPVPGIPLTP